MTERTLKRLLGALGGLAALYLVVVGLVHLARPRAPGSGAFGAMIGRVRTDTLSSVVITVPNGDTVALRRGAAGWTVNGFRTDPAKVDLLVRALADAQVGDLVSKNPATLDRLGVSSGEAWRVEIDGARDTARFLIATAGSDAGNGYARLPNESNVYEVSAKLRAVLTNPVGEWRDKEVARVDTAAVDRLVIAREGTHLELVRSANGWAVDGGGTKLDPSRVAGLLASLDPFNAIGFPADSRAFAGQESRAITVLGAKGETLVTINFVGAGQTWFARIVGQRPFYQVSTIIVDRLTPTLDDLRPSAKKKK